MAIAGYPSTGTVSCVPWCRSHQRIIRASASTTGFRPCKSLYHVRPSVVWRPSLAAVVKNMKRLVGAWFLASQQYFCSSLFLQPQRREKRQDISPETKQRLPRMTGASSPLNTRPPRESMFHNLNFVFSLLSVHWFPSPTALQLPVSPPITNPFFPHLSFLTIQIHILFTPALSLSVTWMLTAILSEEKLKIPANYVAVESLLVLWINSFFNFF